MYKVALYVAELQQETILMYKEQGEFNPSFPSLPCDSFELALQTEFQLELYKNFASSILCIDSTHGTNAYNFKLITCIVADEFGQGTCTNNVLRYDSVGHSTSMYMTCMQSHFYKQEASLLRGVFRTGKTQRLCNIFCYL